jgi:hypothetical protein
MPENDQDLYEYHSRLIAESLAEVEAGTAVLISHDEVKRSLAARIEKKGAPCQRDAPIQPSE